MRTSILALALVLFSASAAQANPQVATVKGLPRAGKIYLTFDDGPHPVITPKILDVLKAHNAPATFFVLGSNIKGREAILKRQANEGHIVGSHQWDHTIFKDATTFRDQIVRTRDAIANVAGTAQPKFFRYPYGAKAPWKETILAEEGYPDGGVFWHIDSLDWAFAGGSKSTNTRPEVPASLKTDFLGWVKYHSKQAGGGIYLGHDVQNITANNLDQILTMLRAEGNTFESLPK